MSDHGMIDKRVLVTGASSGIGLGIALAFLEKGASVVLVSRSLEKMRAAVPDKFQSGKSAGPASAKSGTAHFVAQDLTTAEGCQQCVEEGVKLLGGSLNVLVNNAGAGTYGTPMEDIRIDDWDWHMNVNLRSVFICTQAAMPHLISSKGNIVNISSIAAKRPMQGAAAYCVSKAGVDMLTQQTALEMASKGVRCNALNPATVNTNFHTTSGQTSQEAREEFYEESKRRHPIGRIGQPQDIANMALFLADGETAGWVTGQCIVMDGGRLLLSKE